MNAISSEMIRGFTDIMILSILKDRPSYGYEISRQITERSGDRYRIKETTLYSAFNRFEQRGLVTATPGIESNGRQRTYYHLTDLGRALLDAKIDEWSRTKDIVDRFIEA